MRNFNRRMMMSMTLGLGISSLVRPAFAGLSRVSMDRSGAAIQGYDSRAYWTAGEPMPGSEDHVVRWKDADWRFATAEEAAQFKAAPASFAPKFGGFCTRAMSLKKIVDGDPEVWRIYEGSLYLFARPVGRKHFDKGEAKMIAAAQAHWDTLS
ncbi:MAG: YHS domain-containing (seleno)protein [Sulfitobacter sp.]